MDFCIRSKEGRYLFVVVPSKYVNGPWKKLDRKGFGIATNLQSYGLHLRTMTIDGIQTVIMLVVFGEFIPKKNSDGTPVLGEKGEQKFFYQASTAYRFGSILCYQPGEPVQPIPGHIDASKYTLDGEFSEDRLYTFVGDVVDCYNKGKFALVSAIPQEPQPVYQQMPQPVYLRMPQPFPAMTAEDWNFFQFFKMQLATL